MTDEDLFGDTGSIFDVPSKAKEKKKKRSEGGKDVVSSKDGGEWIIVLYCLGCLT